MPAPAEEFDLSIPLTGHMAKMYLERVNMRASIREVRRDERQRSRKKLNAVVKGLGLQKERLAAENPAMVALTTEQEMEQRRQRLSELNALLADEEEAARSPAGRSRGGFTIPDLAKGPDPERERRLGHLDEKISSHEGQLRKSQSEAALRNAKLQGQTVFEVEKPFEFHWDHLPRNSLLSQNELAFFPRSMKSLREMGTGKDPRFVREMDENYKYREAMLMVAKSKGKDI